MRTCWDCGDEYDTGLYWDHFAGCNASGCGEPYCGSHDTCTYCNGDGYDDAWEEDYEYNSDTGIYSYDFKPEPIWFGGPDAPYYLGFELEISASNFDTSPITAWCNRHADTAGMLYCKEDGSVNGFEIVSHPMTPEFFDSVDWAGFFAMLEHAYPMSGRDEPAGHGLHVHVSRTAFPHKSTLARWSYLLNRHSDHVCRVARRSFSNWAKFTDYPVKAVLPYERSRRRTWYENGAAICDQGCCFERVRVEEVSDGRLTRQYQTTVHPDRYTAVNLTNDHTVEVRVFKSTRKPDEFVSSLHFVVATVEFARTMQPWHATCTSVAWERFSEYVASHPVFAKDATLFTGRAIAQPVTV